MLSRRQFLALAAAASSSAAKENQVRPNIIYIILDDLGLYDLGCYGSQQIKTPNIDRLASQGMRFTSAYSGCSVCAPARATLMTGKHMGHVSLRRNSGGVSLQAGDVTMAEVLQKHGYSCGGFGKWGMGDLETEGVPENHGFVKFFGYYHQLHAHQYYPSYLIDTGRKVQMPTNADFYDWRKNEATAIAPNEGKGGDVVFSAHRYVEEMKRFLRLKRPGPFFAYGAWTIPHARHEIPTTDPAWQLYKDKPWSMAARVHAAYVAMADRFVGEILETLEASGQDKNTLLFFSSDNGAAATYPGELNSGGKLAGKKMQLFEGGIRVPMLAWMPGRIAAGSVNDAPIYFPDILPTVAEITGARPHLPQNLDGISFAGELFGGKKIPRDRTMYWEWDNDHFAYPYTAKAQACRRWPWKLVRHAPATVWSLFNLETDPGETTDVAAAHPKIVEKLAKWIAANRQDPPDQIEPTPPKDQRWR